MHLYTSDSSAMQACVSQSPAESPRQPDRFTVALLSMIVLLMGAAEIVSATRFDRTSKVQRQESAQREVLLSVKDSPATQTAHLAVIGNSLLAEGLNVPLLAARIQPRIIPVPYYVLGTQYYDWYFGLRRLFAEGMRPRYVLLGLSPNQLAFSGTKGDYSARYLFERRDLLNVVRATHMDATTASEFLLSHFSEYYATRSISRGYLLSRLLPGVGELLHEKFSTNREPEIDPGILRKTAAARLVELDRLCRSNGSRFMLVIPPTYQKGDNVIAEAGKENDIPILVPIGNNLLDGSYYSDGFHLNQKGSEIFTSKLSDWLNTIFAK